MVGSTQASRPGAWSAEGGLYFDGLGHQQKGSASRRAWLAARELCFGLGRPQAGCASKGIFCRRFTELGWQQESSVSRGPLPNF